ncbi:hypothetical protein JX266_010029 [Neoarthrinium moseri]|nr:hypothetical protein JX266_010029 [Neoarthrinium moseri]
MRNLQSTIELICEMNGIIAPPNIDDLADSNSPVTAADVAKLREMVNRWCHKSQDNGADPVADSSIDEEDNPHQSVPTGVQETDDHDTAESGTSTNLQTSNERSEPDSPSTYRQASQKRTPSPAHGHKGDQESLPHSSAAPSKSNADAEENATFDCDECRATFKNRHTLKQHSEQVHVGTTCYWPKCNKEFDNEKEVKSHFWEHWDPRLNNNKMYKCNWPGCGRYFARKQQVGRHFSMHNVGARRDEEEQDTDDEEDSGDEDVESEE